VLGVRAEKAVGKPKQLAPEKDFQLEKLYHTEREIQLDIFCIDTEVLSLGFFHKRHTSPLTVFGFSSNPSRLNSRGKN
jgi:hypothetical protein